MKRNHCGGLKTFLRFLGHHQEPQGRYKGEKTPTVDAAIQTPDPVALLAVRFEMSEIPDMNMAADRPTAVRATLT